MKFLNREDIIDKAVDRANERFQGILLSRENEERILRETIEIFLDVFREEYNNIHSFEFGEENDKES